MNPEPPLLPDNASSSAPLDLWFDDLIRSSQTMSAPPAAGTARIVTRQALARLIADTERRSHELESAIRLQSAALLADERRSAQEREEILLGRISGLENDLAEANHLGRERLATANRLATRAEEAEQALTNVARSAGASAKMPEWFGLAAISDVTDEVAAAAELASRLHEPAAGIILILRQRLISTDLELAGHIARLDADDAQFDPAQVLRTVELVTILALTREHLATLRRLA